MDESYTFRVKQPSSLHPMVVRVDQISSLEEQTVEWARILQPGHGLAVQIWEWTIDHLSEVLRILKQCSLVIRLCFYNVSFTRPLTQILVKALEYWYLDELNFEECEFDEGISPITDRFESPDTITKREVECLLNVKLYNISKVLTTIPVKELEVWGPPNDYIGTDHPIYQLNLTELQRIEWQRDSYETVDMDSVTRDPEGSIGNVNGWFDFIRDQTTVTEVRLLMAHIPAVIVPEFIRRLAELKPKLSEFTFIHPAMNSKQFRQLCDLLLECPKLAAVTFQFLDDTFQNQDIVEALYRFTSKSQIKTVEFLDEDHRSHPSHFSFETERKDEKLSKLLALCSVKDIPRVGAHAQVRVLPKDLFKRLADMLNWYSPRFDVVKYGAFFPPAAEEEEEG